MVFIKSVCFYFHCGLDDVWMLICLVFVEDIGHRQNVTSLSVLRLEPCLCTNLLSCVCGGYWSQTGRHLLVYVTPRTVSLYKPFVLCLWRVLVTDRTSPPCLCFAWNCVCTNLLLSGAMKGKRMLELMLGWLSSTGR